MSVIVEEEIVVDADTMIVSGQPTYNLGTDSYAYIGNTSIGGIWPLSGYFRTLLRFTIPEDIGDEREIKTIRLKIDTFLHSGVTIHTCGIYLVESPQDDVWEEGTGNSGGAPTPLTYDGATWNDFAFNFPWSAGGGDFDSAVIGQIRFPAGTGNGWKYIDIPIDNWNIQKGKTYTLILKAGTESVSTGFAINTKELVLSVAPRLLLGFDYSDIYGPPAILTEEREAWDVKVTWERSGLDPSDFVRYEFAYGHDGITYGSISYIVNQDTTFSRAYIQSPFTFDPYDEDNDTYPGGDVCYYRVRVRSTKWGDSDWTYGYETSFPAVRPFKFTNWEPYCFFQDDEWSEDNYTSFPYGAKIKFEWYDPADTTPFEHIGYMKFEFFYRDGTGWSGTSYVETYDQEEMEEWFNNGVPIPGYGRGYTVYKVNGKAYSEDNNVVRYFTSDKLTLQDFHTECAPVPVVVPAGAYGSTPPDLGGPFDSGTTINPDLSLIAQQTGGDIFVEDMNGTPTDYGKWYESSKTGTPDSPSYGIGLCSGAETCLKLGGKTSGGTWILHVAKYLRDETPANPNNTYNRYLSMFTGGYTVESVFSVPSDWSGGNWDAILGTQCWNANIFGIGAGGYWVRWSSAGTMELWRGNNFIGGAMTLLNSHSPPVHPSTPLGQYFYAKIVVSPIFANGVSGNHILVITKNATTLSSALNIDLDDTSNVYTWTYYDSGKSASEQQHYTGRTGLYLTNDLGTPTSPFEVYHYEIFGRINQSLDSSLGQGYRIKNIQTDELTGLTTNNKPSLDVFCEPDQATQSIYLEAWTKNSYGAQSRTGEVNDYQGDIFNNINPTAIIISSSVGKKDVSMLFNGSLSSDPEGGILTYSWDWDDGSPIEYTTESLISHIFTSTGTFTVSMRVTDEAGKNSIWVSKIIRIIDQIDNYVPVTFLCDEPFTSVVPSREPGFSEIPVPGYPNSYYQNNKEGGRRFAIAGVTIERSTLDQSTLEANAKEEIDTLDAFSSEGILVEIDLPAYGTIKGFISGFKANVGNNKRYFTWTFTLYEMPPDLV